MIARSRFNTVAARPGLSAAPYTKLFITFRYNVKLRYFVADDGKGKGDGKCKDGNVLYFPGCRIPPQVVMRAGKDVLPLYEALARVGEGLRPGAGARIALESAHENAARKIRFMAESAIAHYSSKVHRGEYAQKGIEGIKREQITGALAYTFHVQNAISLIFPKVAECDDAGVHALFRSFEEKAAAFLEAGHYFRPVVKTDIEFRRELEPMLLALCSSTGIEAHGLSLPAESMISRYRPSIEKAIADRLAGLSAPAHPG